MMQACLQRVLVYGSETWAMKEEDLARLGRTERMMGIKEEMAQDRCAWRNITGSPTRASTDA